MSLEARTDTPQTSCPVMDATAAGIHHKVPKGPVEPWVPRCQLPFEPHGFPEHSLSVVQVC